MESWLKNMLIDKDHMTTQGMTRNARIIPCPKCKQPAIAGFDADRCALDTWLDTTELNPTHELQALLTHRETYELIPRPGNKWHITRRDQFRVTHPPKHPLLATHQCNNPIPKSWEQPQQPTQPKQPTQPTHTDPDTIPF